MLNIPPGGAYSNYSIFLYVDLFSMIYNTHIYSSLHQYMYTYMSPHSLTSVKELGETAYLQAVASGHAFKTSSVSCSRTVELSVLL